MYLQKAWNLLGDAVGMFNLQSLSFKYTNANRVQGKYLSYYTQSVHLCEKSSNLQQSQYTDLKASH